MEPYSTCSVCQFLLFCGPFEVAEANITWKISTRLQTGKQRYAEKVSIITHNESACMP